MVGPCAEKPERPRPMPLLPTLFVSHGSPMVMLEPDSGLHRFLAGLGSQLPRPAAVLSVTAHWETRAPVAGSAAQPGTIHDFYGFPDALYEFDYPAPGAPDAASAAVRALAATGIEAALDTTRGYDHGTWVPLKLMYPDADIPIAQLSVQPALGGAWHVALGRALAPLRAQGVMVMGSGSAVHNLRLLRRYAPDSEAWAVAFQDWLSDAVTGGRTDDLANYRHLAPDAVKAHPSDEHLLPLLVAAGAGGGKGRVLHAGMEHGSLGTAAYVFD